MAWPCRRCPRRAAAPLSCSSSAACRAAVRPSVRRWRPASRPDSPANPDRPRKADPMFFIYLRRELRRRMRQAVFIALGLALGVGLVVTVAAASAGVSKAQSGVLSALYGVGTDITVTGNAPPPHYSSAGSPQPSKAITPSKNGNGETLHISPGGG